MVLSIRYTPKTQNPNPMTSDSQQGWNVALIIVVRKGLCRVSGSLQCASLGRMSWDAL